MIRRFTPNNMVELPTGGLLENLSMASDMIAAAHDQKAQYGAKGEPFPEHFALALERLETSTTELAKLIEGNEDEPKGQVEARAALEDAWEKFHTFLSSWIKADAKKRPGAAGAKIIHKIAFSDGKDFITVPAPRFWVESERRIKGMDRERDQPIFLVMSGDGIYDSLKAAHADYSLTLGVETERPKELTPDEAMRRMRDDLRYYILRAIAWSEPTIPGSKELSEALLEPMASRKMPPLNIPLPIDEIEDDLA